VTRHRRRNGRAVSAVDLAGDTIVCEVATAGLLAGRRGAAVSAVDVAIDAVVGIVAAANLLARGGNTRDRCGCGSRSRRGDGAITAINRPTTSIVNRTALAFGAEVAWHAGRSSGRRCGALAAVDRAAAAIVDCPTITVCANDRDTIRFRFCQ
jgi:hypothetical protein